MSKPRIVKRYSNRKLYDTQTSSYVTLEQIAEMVRDKEDVKIVDNKTKKDLTSVTLAQIVFEEEKKRRLVPLNTLKTMIQNKGESISGFVTQLGRDIDKQVGRVFRRHPQKDDDEQHRTGETDTETEESTNLVSTHVEPTDDDQDLEDVVVNEEHTQHSHHHALDLLRDWLMASQKSFDDWQSKLDEQIRKVFESMSPLAPLQKQVEALNKRVEDLEKMLKNKDE